MARSAQAGYRGRRGAFGHRRGRLQQRRHFRPGGNQQRSEYIFRHAGQGQRHIHRAPTISPPEICPRRLPPRILTPDGRLDVAVTNQTDNTLSIYPGNGDGTFGSVTNFDTGATPVALAVSDFNSDGLPDLVAANEGANTISVFLNLGAGNFVSPISLPTDGPPWRWPPVPWTTRIRCPTWWRSIRIPTT